MFVARGPAWGAGFFSYVLPSERYLSAVQSVTHIYVAEEHISIITICPERFIMRHLGLLLKSVLVAFTCGHPGLGLA